MDPAVQLQEARVPGFFIPKTIVICKTSTISAHVGVLLKEVFSSGIKHSYLLLDCKITCLVPNTPNQSLFQISKLQNLSTTQKQCNPHNASYIHS